MSARDDLDRSTEVVVRRVPDPRVTAVARKGGGKAGGAGAVTTPHQPQEMPNTLRSRATARVAELLSEGPVRGIHPTGNHATIWQSIYLDGTPVADPSGNFQFAIRDGHFRQGYPGQDPIPGYPTAEASFAVGIKCEFAIPVVRATNVPISAVRYIVRIPALYEQESSGDVVQASVAYAFDINVDGGGWQNAVTERISGKTMSPYERAVRFNIPPQSSSLQIRIERLDPPPPSNRAADIYFASYVEIIDSTVAYDDSCVAAVTISAEEFQNVPQRAYLLDGLAVQLPNNYDPFSRTYTHSDWDGGFGFDWTNNPAWILYALMTNERWGLGRYFSADAVDKWSFYEAGRHCDDFQYAFGDFRFSCDVVINTRQDAFTVLQAVASNMLAQLYYSNGTVFLVQDRRIVNPVRLFGPADVEAGLFDYASADARSRFNAVAVTWNDPGDKYEPAVELVQDPGLVAQQGYKETQVALFGCTYRGQAIRHGRWIIYTSQFETETCTFRTGLENADLRPGDLIYVSDPSRVGARLAGRTLDDTGDLATLALDHLDEHIAAGWTLHVTIGSAAVPDQPQSVIVLSVLAVIDAAAGLLQVSGKGAPIAAGSMWIARSAAVEPRPWRVTAIADRGAGKYEVTCTEYHVQKFDYIEQGVNIPLPPFSLIPTGPLLAPSNLAFTEFIYLDGSGFPQFGIIMSWSASADPRVTRYQLELSGPAGDYRRFGQIGGVAQEVLAMREGEWFATLLAFDNIGRRAQPVTLTFTPVGRTERPLPPASLFVTPQGRTTTLIWVPTGEIDVVYYWCKWSPQTTAGATWARAVTSIAKVDRNTTQITTPTRSGTYMIKTIDALGQESDDWADAIQVEQITEDVHIINIKEQPDWGGDLGPHWHRRTSELMLPPPETPDPPEPEVFPGDRDLILNRTPTRIATYAFQDELDLGIVSSVSMIGIVEGYAAFLGVVMARWIPLASAVPLAMGANNSMSTWRPLAMARPLAMGSSSNSENWDAHIDVAVSQDGVTFAPFTPLKSALITGRRFQFQLHGLLYDLETTARIVRAEVWIEVPLRNISGNDVALDTTGHLSITYATPFLVTPTVQITARQSLAPGGNVVIVASDASHFRVEHRNAAGAPVTGLPNASIDYFVQGYGGGIPLAA